MEETWQLSESVDEHGEFNQRVFGRHRPSLEVWVPPSWALDKFCFEEFFSGWPTHIELWQDVLVREPKTIALACVIVCLTEWQSSDESAWEDQTFFFKGWSRHDLHRKCWEDYRTKISKGTTVCNLFRLNESAYHDASNDCAGSTPVTGQSSYGEWRILCLAVTKFWWIRMRRPDFIFQELKQAWPALQVVSYVWSDFAWLQAEMGCVKK